MASVEFELKRTSRNSYRIYFACSLPGEPGCGYPDNDFHAEHEFIGTPEGAIKEAERTSLQKYQGDFSWWIVENPNIKEVDIEKKAEPKDNEQRFTSTTRMTEVIEESPLITYHESKEELESILDEPSYLSISLPLPTREGQQEFHHIQFDLFDNDVLVDGGNQKPGSCPGRKYGEKYGKSATESSVTVREMLYRWNLVYGIRVTHVLRTERYTSFHTDEFVKKNPLKFDIYTFSPDPKLLRKAEEERQAELEEEKRWQDALIERLIITGTTLKS